MSSTEPLAPAPTQTSLGSALRAIVEVLQLDELFGPDAIPAALQEMEAELLVIGADAYRAEVQGITLRNAVRDHERCPALTKLHTSLEDVLTLGLPKELRGWARRLLVSGVPPAFEAMLHTLVRHARRDPSPIRRALCRLLVFEGVRFGLLLRAKLSTDDSYGVGMIDDDVDTIAERETLIWMDDSLPWTGELESLDAIATAGLISLERHLALLRETMQTAGRELREMLERRARFEARLFELDARDAILIRNAFAAGFEVQPLSLDLVRERHPAAFGDVKRGAMDTRLSRLRNNGVRHIVPRKDSLIDLLREAQQLPSAAPAGE
jgi:hypothetical protein